MITIRTLIFFLFILLFPILVLANNCSEDLDQITATFNSSVYERPGTRAICVVNDTGSQHNVLVCWDKSTSSSVCGDNHAQVCPLIRMENEQSKLVVNITALHYTTLVVKYKFYLEGHFYGVDTEICRHTCAQPTLHSSVQAGESLITLVFQPSSISPSKSLPAGAGESPSATSVSVTSPPVAGESPSATSMSVTSPPVEHKGLKIGAGIAAVGCVLLFASVCLALFLRRRCMRSRSSLPTRPDQDVRLSEIHHGDDK